MPSSSLSIKLMISLTTWLNKVVRNKKTVKILLQPLVSFSKQHNFSEETIGHTPEFPERTTSRLSDAIITNQSALSG